METKTRQKLLGTESKSKPRQVLYMEKFIIIVNFQFNYFYTAPVYDTVVSRRVTRNTQQILHEQASAISEEGKKLQHSKIHCDIARVSGHRKGCFAFW